MGGITNTAQEAQQSTIPKTEKAPTLPLPLAPFPYTDNRFDAALDAAGLELRLNIRSQRQQYRREPVLDWEAFMGGTAQGEPSPWQELTDTEAIKLRAELATAGFPVSNNEGLVDNFLVVLDLSEKEFSDAVRRVCAINAVDPFLEYLENDIPRWDGLPRLSVWIWNCFDVADESLDLADWASEFILLGAVQRAYHPGSKLDEVPVIIGPGGIGKSTALRELFPPELQDLFTDGLNLSGDTKTRVEALQGRAVVELAEMAGARRADIESLKAFISRTDQGSVRLTWRHNPEPLPRRCIIVGTADRSDPLPPDHNLRRFVPVSLIGGDVGRLLAFMEANRGQLWAEALRLYERGQDARLPDWLKDLQREATDAARPTDAIQDGVENYLETAPEPFTLETIAYAIRLIEGPEDGAKITPADQQRIGAALRHFGYQKARRRVDGKLKNVYSK